MMPGMDGLSVLKVLRSQPTTRNIPVLLLTATYPDHIPSASTELGSVQFLTKPFAMRDLLAKITDSLQAVVST
jgi:CheY-like chemotaxis protein